MTLPSPSSLGLSGFLTTASILKGVVSVVSFPLPTEPYRTIVASRTSPVNVLPSMLQNGQASAARTDVRTSSDPSATGSQRFSSGVISESPSRLGTRSLVYYVPAARSRASLLGGMRDEG